MYRHLSLVLVVTLFLALVLPIRVMAAEGADIPYGKLLTDYVPERDGYYGYLPVYVLENHETARHRLPVLIWNGTVCADAESLSAVIPGVDISMAEDHTEAQLYAQNHSLSLAAGKNAGIFCLQSTIGDCQPLLSEAVSLDIPCVKMDDRLWVPLTQTACLLGIGCAMKDTSVLFTTPQRGALDVLADLCSPSYRAAITRTLTDREREQWLQKSVGAGIVLGIDSLTRLDIFGFWRSAAGTNIPTLLDRIAGIDQNELAAAGSRLLNLYGTASDLMNTFASGYQTPFNMDAYLPSPLPALLDTAVVAAGLTASYQARDQLAIEALALFSEKSEGGAMDAGLKKEADKRIKSMHTAFDYTKATALDRKWTDIAMEIAKYGTKKLPGTAFTYVNTAAMISSGYTMVFNMLSANVSWWSDSMDEIECFQDMFYGMQMQRDTEAMLLAFLPGMDGSTTPGEMKEMIEAGYLHLKTCQVTRTVTDMAFGLDPGGSSDLYTRCSEDMMLLADQYQTHIPIPGELLRRSGGIDQTGFLNAAEPLYELLSGQVLAGESADPVTDAVLTFTYDGQVCGRTENTPDGRYMNVAVPVAIPVLDCPDPEDDRICIHAESDAAGGEGDVFIRFEAAQEREAVDIVLRRWISGYVIDAVTRKPLSGVQVDLGTDRLPAQITDENGFWSADLPDASGLHIHFTKEGYKNSEAGIGTIKGHHHFIQEMPPLYAVTGIVLNKETGDALPDVSVICGNNDHTYTTFSDTSGSFTLQAVEPGDYELTFSLSGFEDAHDTVHHQEGFISVVLPVRMKPGAIAVTINVTDAETGAALPGAAIACSNDKSSYSGTTDTSGSCSLKGVADGSYHLAVSLGGYTEASLDIIISDAGVRSISVALVPQSFKYEILADNTARITKYYGKSKEVTIPGKLDGYIVTEIGEQAFARTSGMTAVKFPDSLRTIGSYAFFDCNKLKNVTIPDSVTTLEPGAFERCSGMIGVTLPKHLTEISEYLFCDCGSLTGVVIPEGVTATGHKAFYGCRSLTSVALPDSLTTIGDTSFCHCTGLTEVTIPAGVRKIEGNAFYGCTSLTGVAIPDGVEIIQYCTFQNCTGLTDVSIPNSVRLIDFSAFENCISLSGVALPETVGEIRHRAFFGCSGLTGVTIPGRVTMIGESAFENCTGLISAYIPESVKYIGGNAFAGCDQLTMVVSRYSYADSYCEDNGYRCRYSGD